jgi:hypothetical protein
LWKQEGKPTCSKPLKLDSAAIFTRIIPDFIENDEVFKHSLKIDDGKGVIIFSMIRCSQ